ncbi:methyltransferase domain-containing protein [Candidatus Pelagibacter sp.]|nr:methyltransferase domain-containing protein [Candidatus Pelagibacter sp.]|tara:strand:+ start:358 stop:1002 length:645 start_codon:yes stop_codon:yes gene_type:complete
MSIKVNIGCGRSPTNGWINMDNSPAIKLANSPFKYKIARTLKLLNPEQIENIEWNKLNKIQFADATKSLPLKDSSVECIYTSHMFEHLSQIGARSFLKEAKRALKSGGVLRIAIPDLKIAIEKYLKSRNADSFMQEIFVQAPPISSLKQKIMLFVSGYRHHQWMYDGESLSKLLRETGFKEIEICEGGYTKILDPDELNLNEQEDSSVYVESVK